MKRFWWFLVLVIISCPLVAMAATPQFLVMDQVNGDIEVFGSDYQSILRFKSGEKPLKVLSLPDQQGYALLYRGSGKLLSFSNKPGGINYLDQQMKPTGKNLPLPGQVIYENYLSDSSKWVIFTTNNVSNGKQGAIINVIDVNSGSHQQFPLETLPTAYRFYNDQKLALTLLGDPDRKIQPQAVVVDLEKLTSKSYSVSINPGAIYFIDDQHILVGCGGFRDTIKYFTNLIMETTNNTTPASVHIIDTESGKVDTIQAGFTPLVVLQDNQQSDTFYVASTKDAYNSEAGGRFQIIKGNQVISEIALAGEPVFLSQPSTGKVCVLGRSEFFLIDPVTKDILGTIKNNLKAEKLLFSQDQKTGYLTFANSSYIKVIDLETGQSNTQIKIGKTGFLGTLDIGNLMPNSYPPVIGMNLKMTLHDETTTQNSRMFFTSDYSKIYTLSARSEVSVIDVKTNQVINEIRFAGKSFGIHPTPNGKYCVVSTNSAWHLLAADQKKPVLSVTISKNEPLKFPLTGYYSPDGKLLVIPFEKSIFVIDVDQGKLIGKYKTKIRNIKVVWPE